MGAKMTGIYGPIPFRLNQGTAKTWRALLENPPWRFDPAQLSFVGSEGDTWGSPEGLLASIAYPEPETAWDGVSHLYDGAQFHLSPHVAARLKLRGTLPEFASFEHALWYLDEMAAHHGLSILAMKGGAE